MIKVEILLASSLSHPLAFSPHLSLSHEELHFIWVQTCYTHIHFLAYMPSHLLVYARHRYIYVLGVMGVSKKAVRFIYNMHIMILLHAVDNKPHNFILHYVMLSVRCSCDGEGCRCWRGLYANSPTRLSFWPQKSSWQYHSFQHLDLKTSRGHQCTQWAESQGSVDGFLFHTSIHLK